MMRHQPRMQFLGFYEEVNGILTELTVDQGLLIARISDANIVLPTEMENKLQPLRGTCLGILHTDIPGAEYLLRSISDEISPALDKDNMIELTVSKVQRGKASA